jgi:hypothetical protein
MGKPTLDGGLPTGTVIIMIFDGSATGRYACTDVVYWVP